MGQTSLLALFFLFCTSEGGLQQLLGQEFPSPRQKPLQSSPYQNRFHSDQNIRSEFFLTYDKRGFLGKVTFDVDVMLPLHSNVTHIDLKFDPESDLAGEVYVTRGGRGLDFATVHFESAAEGGRVRAFITLDSR